MNTIAKGKNAFYVLVALFVAAFFALSSALTAVAAPVIDKTSTGNLHITKLDTPATAPEASQGAQVQLPDSAKPIAGVEFEVKQINNIDLSTNQGWESLSGLTLDEKKAEVTGNGDDGKPVSLGENKASGKTNEQGLLDVTGLPVGAYLVTETVTPEGVTPGLPFIVTVPITDPKDPNNWIYDVYVYPKNSKVNPNNPEGPEGPQTPMDPNDPNNPFDPDLGDPNDPNLPNPGLPKLLKQINDKQPYENGGQKVTYTIWSPLPRPVSNDPKNPWAKPDGFKIEDELPTGFTASSVEAALVYRTDLQQKSEVKPLANGSDFDGATGAMVSVNLTDAGLEKVQAAAPDANARIKVTITATVSGDIEKGNDGLTQARNWARVYVDKDAIDKGVEGKRWLATTLVDSYWGSFSFIKTDKDGAKLENAEFNLALSKSQAEKNEFIRGAAALSGTDGEVSFAGLRASDFANAKPQKAGVQSNGAYVANDKYIVYWLTETKAPTGYVPLAEPIPVVLLKDGTVKEVKVDDQGAAQFSDTDGTVVFAQDTALSSVINVKTNGGFTLPLTGGNGTWLLTLGGIALLLFVLFAARRRNNDSETA